RCTAAGAQSVRQLPTRPVRSIENVNQAVPARRMRGLVGADVRGEGRSASTYPAGVFLDPARRLPALLAAVTGGAPLVSAAVAAIGFPVGQVLVHLAHGAWRGSGVSAGAAAEPGSRQPGQPDGSVAGALHRHQRQNSL